MENAASRAMFDTKGDPDQMMMFDDGVTPEDRLMPEAKKPFEPTLLGKPSALNEEKSDAPAQPSLPNDKGDNDESQIGQTIPQAATQSQAASGGNQAVSASGQPQSGSADRGSDGTTSPTDNGAGDDENQMASGNDAKPVNPFRAQADAIRRKAEQLSPGGDAHSKAMASAFPLGVGRSGNASSRRTSAQAAKRIDRSVDNALKSTELFATESELLRSKFVFPRCDDSERGSKWQVAHSRLRFATKIDAGLMRWLRH